MTRQARGGNGRRFPRLDAIAGEVEKQYGVKLMMAPGSVDAGLNHLPTGIALLDYSLFGGIPEGRANMVFGWENSGKTTLAMRIAASAVRKHPDKACVFIDAEGTFDPLWADKHGLDPESIYLVQPESGEQAVNIIDAVMKERETGCVILDSLPALVPQSMLDAAAEDPLVARRAQLIGRMCSVITSSFNIMRPTGHVCTFVMINQWRMKIGPCFNYNAKVLLADGTKEKIGKIVNQKLDVEVLSYNEDTGQVEPKRIVQWHNHGPAPYFIRLKFDGGKNGFRHMLVTDNHNIFVPGGKKKAADLEVGDDVLVTDYKYFSEDQHRIILGSILGDGSLRFEGEHNRRGHLRVGHGIKQEAYCAWKAAALDAEIRGNGIDPCWFETRRSQEFEPYKAFGKKQHGVRHVLKQFIRQIDAKTVAIWYMDDGSLSGSHRYWGYGKFKIGAASIPMWDKERLAEHMAAIGLGQATVSKDGFLWSGQEAAKFAFAISPYVHPSMYYKLPRRNHGRFNWDVERTEPSLQLYTAKVVSVGVRNNEGRGRVQRNKYDIGVADNHNYFVDGVLVHNSFGDPRVLPGGQQPKYLCSHMIETKAKPVVGKDDNGLDRLLHTDHTFVLKKHKGGRTRNSRIPNDSRP